MRNVTSPNVLIFVVFNVCLLFHDTHHGSGTVLYTVYLNIPELHLTDFRFVEF